MNTYLIRRSAMLFITIVAVILLNMIVASADEPGPKYPPRRPIEKVSPTPTDPVTPPVTPTRERDRPSPPAEDTPIVGTSTPTPPPPPPPTIRWWVWVSCLILLLLLLLLVWLLRRRKSPPSPGYPPPSQPGRDTGYTPQSPVQQSPRQQAQSQYRSES